MAGYSGTPLPKKLGIKPDSRVAVLHAAAPARPVLDEIAAASDARTSLAGARPFDVILLFCRATADLHARFARAHSRLAQNGGLWIAWPKKASGIPTDLNENLIREHGLAAGLVDNKVCAIDNTWSGLRFVIRVADRKPAPPPSRK